MSYLVPERRGHGGAPLRTYIEAKARLIERAYSAAPDYVERVFGEKGYDPLVSLAVTSVTTTDLGLRSLCDKEIAKYFYSPRKALDMPEDETSDVEVKVDLVNGILEAVRKNGQPRVGDPPSAPPVNGNGMGDD